MNNIKRFLPLAFLLVLIVTCFVFPASATSFEGDDVVINVEVDGQNYTFQCPEGVDTYEKLFLASFEQPGLGYCSFGASDEGIYLYVPDDDSQNRYFLRDRYGVFVDVDTPFYLFWSDGPYSTVLHSGCITHRFVSVPLVERTCAASYEVINRCKDCGYNFVTLASPEPHEYKTHYVLATCTEPGYYYIQCTVCSFIRANVPLDPDGHDYSWGKCTRCGDLWIAPGDDGSVGDFVDKVGGFIQEGVDNIGGSIQEVVDNIGGAIQEGIDKVEETIKGDGSDKEKPGLFDGIKEWFDKLKKDVSALLILVALIISGCIIIALLPVLVPFFKWVGKGIAFTWNSLKDLFKAAGKAVRKASRSRSGKNKNKKRKKK